MRYLVFADVHANVPAMQAVLAAEEWDEIIFLGDIVSYGPHPAEAVDMLAELSGVFLEGNHDRSIGDLDPDCDPPNDEPGRWAHWTRRQLEPRHLEVLDRLEAGRSLQDGGVTFHLHHGDFDPDGIPDFSGRLWPDSASRVFRDLAKRFGPGHLLHGHTHVQFELEQAGVTFANPGSVGQPRLGEPDAAYAILENGELSYHATPYDVEATCSDMDELPLDAQFIDAWKEAFRTAELPAYVDLRDFRPLRRVAIR